MSDVSVWLILLTKNEQFDWKSNEHIPSPEKEEEKFFIGIKDMVEWLGN